MVSGKTLGQVAFEAYRDQLGGVRPWSDVREPERQVWEETARAVARNHPPAPQDDHDPAACRNGDHYGQCSGVTR